MPADRQHSDHLRSTSTDAAQDDASTPEPTTYDPTSNDPTGDELLQDPRLAPSAVDAVVFDLGNVLIRWDPMAAVAAAVGEERAAAFLANPEFDFARWNHEQDAGRPWAEAEAAAIERHPELAEEIAGYRANFDASLVGAIDDTVAVLRDVHASGVPVVALTNWSAELFPAALDRFDFLDLFEDIVVSGEEGVAKPDAEIFQILGERMRHLGSLDDAIFVDDSPANVQAAEEAGLDAILFTGPGHLREDLRARGLDLPQ
ncbi:HAD family hydrolase [Barrientosiimonas endolithica]|uniref:Haloacid dehalogenase n=1 Tax=Barrientosiimonas endolithica TaxID=1535208 RepID=A0ABM8HBF6_9MICO|nr:HAD-IA family hydrolase [Barrientosiimonas endolithica]BDZ58267.1 haloacid dehalogenase [Barrientosiimonas endolithica]